MEHSPEFRDFVYWAFLTLLLGGGGLLVSYIRSIGKSIAKLNVHVAQIFERVLHHDKEIDRMNQTGLRHEERIQSLEQDRGKRPRG